MPDREWEGMCSYVGASPNEGLPAPAFLKLMQGAPDAILEKALDKLAGSLKAGVLEEDIELVMKKAVCNREEAITALKNNNSDTANAITAHTNTRRWYYHRHRESHDLRVSN